MAIGNIKSCVHEWANIGAPKCVTEWLSHGVPLPFVEQPVPIKFNNKHFNEAERNFLCNEINDLLNEGIIQYCEKPHCITPISVVPKKDKSYRLIADLRYINKCLQVPKFSYDDLDSVLAQIEPGDFLVTLDIRKGFYHIPIHADFQNYLAFQFNGVCYKWCFLPFGLSVSPYYFNKIIRSIVTHLRQCDINVTVYVDDFCISAKKDCINVCSEFVQCLLQKLGLKIYYEKSSLDPDTCKEFIGYEINTVNSDGNIWISIPKRRIRVLKRDIKYVSQKVQCRHVVWPGLLDSVFLWQKQ